MPACSLMVNMECFWALAGEEEGKMQILTLPTSTSLVIMTMLKQFSCHTILQKSYNVSCLGPSGKREELRYKEPKKNPSASKSVLSIKGEFASVKSPIIVTFLQHQGTDPSRLCSQ